MVSILQATDTTEGPKVAYPPGSPREIVQVPVMQVTSVKVDASVSGNFIIHYRKGRQEGDEKLKEKVAKKQQVILLHADDRQPETWCEAFEVFINTYRQKTKVVKARRLAARKPSPHHSRSAEPRKGRVEQDLHSCSSDSSEEVTRRGESGKTRSIPFHPERVGVESSEG